MHISELESGIRQIFDRIVQSESKINQIASHVHPQYRLSAKNLYRYLILRSFDLRQFHDHLSDLGISSLRSAEGYVYTGLLNVVKLLNLVHGQPWQEPLNIEKVGYRQSSQLLKNHANLLFNEYNKEHFTEIMVSMANEMADDPDLIKKLTSEGMEIARINLSHGNQEIWSAMIHNIKKVRKETGKELKIYMDLSGPKIRTSEILIYSKKGKPKEFVKLKVGDHLILTKRKTKGKSTTYSAKQELLQAAEVGVLLPQIIEDLKIGDSVYFDDGMIKGEVIAKTNDDAKLMITNAYKSKLSANKGINLPKTTLNLPSLTARDIELLPFICQHADLLGYSFVRTPADVAKLYLELEKLNNQDIGVIFKIENQESFENLPGILFEAMRRNKIGVMIARGDLAVELGFERISEVQNQILWFCEAAHIPVIWATQVLDNLAKTGVATRAEVSDASLSAQAECVMLNKGPFIVDAVRTLRNILIKMEGHTRKKKSALRALKVAKSSLEKLSEIS